MDHMLGSGGLDEGDSIELAQERNEPSKICSGRCGEGDGAGGALGGMEEFAEETLDLHDEDGHQGEELQAENLSFFHFEGVDGHGESDVVEDHPNPGDDGRGALALRPCWAEPWGPGEGANEAGLGNGCSDSVVDVGCCVCTQLFFCYGRDSFCGPLAGWGTMMKAEWDGNVQEELVLPVKHEEGPV